MNNHLLQTLDGLPVTNKNSNYPYCVDCGARLKEGSEIVAHAYLDRKWHVRSVHCADCYSRTAVSHTRDLEEATVEARIGTRSDCATQSDYHILHTRGGYGVLRHTEGGSETSVG